MESLGSKLFKEVEESQGNAFISDSVERYPEKEVLIVARNALFYTERTARRLRKFLKENAYRADE